MFGMGMPEILLILGIALIVIGPKKLPDLAKSLGRALGEFKKATSDLKESMQIDNELTDVKSAFDELNSDTDKKEKSSADKNRAAADIKTEEAVADDNTDEANQHKDADSSKPPAFSDVESAEMTDAPLTPPAENDNNVPMAKKRTGHPDVTTSDEKNKEI
jgi:TatA/E family protein of Tat protein translocase